MRWTIEGRRVLCDGAIRPAVILIDGERIADILPFGAPAQGLGLDAGDRLVLPGIVDLHGDGFERQIMPRPGVRFGLDLAFLDTDRQLLANGITTAFHAVTYSWEPGLRGAETVREIVAAWRGVQPRLGCDTGLHLRFETYNLAGAEEVAGWLADGTIGLLAFNDHLDDIADELAVPHKAAKYAERTGLDVAGYRGLLEQVKARAPEVPETVRGLAQAARASGVPMLSHDDPTAEARGAYAGIGCRIAEFPITEEAAIAARRAGDPVVMGAPNVLRGGSHKRIMAAADMVERGLCTVLASDYFYPAPLQSAFRLAADGIAALPAAWALVSANPAEAVGLADRGVLAPGRRADLVLAENSGTGPVAVSAAVVAGRLRYVGDPNLAGYGASPAPAAEPAENP